jgi:WD40 repeat protein
MSEEPNISPESEIPASPLQTETVILEPISRTVHSTRLSLPYIIAMLLLSLLIFTSLATNVLFSFDQIVVQNGRVIIKPLFTSTSTSSPLPTQSPTPTLTFTPTLSPTPRSSFTPTSSRTPIPSPTVDLLLPGNVPGLVEAKRFEIHVIVHSLTLSPNGNLLAVVGENGSLKVYKILDEDLVFLYSILTDTNCAVFSPDNSMLISAGDDRTIHFWNAITGSPGQVITGHTMPIYTLAFSPDGEFLASGADVNITPGGGLTKLRLWQIEPGSAASAVNTLEGQTGAIRSLAFSPDGATLASGSAFSENCAANCDPLPFYTSDIYETCKSDCQNTVFGINLWYGKTGEPMRALSGISSDIYSLVYSPDGSLLASGSWDTTVRLWSNSTLQTTLSGHQGSVLSLAFSPDGQILASGSADTTIRLWHIPDGEFLKELQGHLDSVTGLAFSPDGRLLISASADETIRFWEIP